MKAVILAGGAGTRLMPYTRVLPKPLLPIGDRPVLEIMVEQLRDAGVTQVVMATGYLSSLIETFFGDGSGFGVPITYAREPHRSGTAGPLAGVEGLDSTFLVVNGDILTSPLFGDLLDAHRESGACATLAVRSHDVEIDFGVVEFGDPHGNLRGVARINEKPRQSVPVYSGIGAFEPQTLEHLRANEYADVPDWIHRLIAAGKPVAAYDHTGYWADVGTVHDLERAVADFERTAERLVDRETDDAYPRQASDTNGNGQARSGDFARLVGRPKGHDSR